MIANVFNHQLFWEKQRKNINSLFCTLFKKRLSFCCFDSYHCQTSLSKEEWFCVKYHHWKKQQRPKKVSNFHLATFVWLNKNFEHISPKLGLLRRNRTRVKKSFTPIKRFIHFLFLLLKLSTNIYVRMKKFPFFAKF